MKWLKNTSMAAILGVLLCSCAQDPSQSSVVKYGASRGEGSRGVHTVLRGDTLYSVSKRYHLPITEIVTVNNISEPYILRTGYRLKLPPPNEHKVREDDTIVGIARTYSVSPSELVRLNDLQPPYRLSAGQVLHLPTPSIEAQDALYDVPQETTNGASVAHVERAVLGTSRAGAPTPSNKPQAVGQPTPRVQKASAAVQSRLLKEVPKSSGNGKFMRPVEGKIISTYGPKKGGLHNDGINIKAARGAPVRAAENGRVVYVGDDLEGYGNLILVRHEGRYMSAYAHLGKSLVKKGDAVKRGQSIGTVGSSGQVDSPQLHFEIRKGTKALDPQRYL